MSDTENNVNMQTEPVLTLDPFQGQTAQAPEAPQPQVQTRDAGEMAEEDVLTEDEKKQVDAFAKQIDISNSTLVMQYGAGAQAKVASFSDTALNNVQGKDLGEVGKLIGDVVVELKGFDIDKEEKGLFGFFKKQGNKTLALKAKYDKVENSVETIANSLENHQVTLMKDVATLDQLYDLNLTYYKELTMYILAGKKKLKEVEEVEIPQLAAKAKETGSQEDAQKVNDLTAMANRFEKKIHDLELTRTISLQMGPQIRLVQNNDIMMSDKIQSTLVNTIPLWKSQMVIALGLQHSSEAAKAEQAVSELTNQMLRENSEKLKTASIDIAKQSERGIVDMETLQKTNEDLISTLDEVMQIQTDCRQKRKEAEAELEKIESELKQKLISTQQIVK